MVETNATAVATEVLVANVQSSVVCGAQTTNVVALEDERDSSSLVEENTWSETRALEDDEWETSGGEESTASEVKRSTTSTGEEYTTSEGERRTLALKARNIRHLREREGRWL